MVHLMTQPPTPPTLPTPPTPPVPATPPTPVPPAPQQPYTQQPQPPQPPYTQQSQQPYEQSSYNPPYTYGQDPYTQSQQPYGQQPYAQQPYAQQPQPPYGQPPIPPMPPAPQQQPSGSHNGCLIATVIVAIVAVVITLGGCVACSVMGAALLDETPSTTTQRFDSDDQDLAQEDLNADLIDFFDLDADPAKPLSAQNLETIQKKFDELGLNTDDAKGSIKPGVYVIGQNLDAGSYWMYGNDATLSYYFLLKATDDNAALADRTYNVEGINNYYGHNIIELEAGDALIVINEDGMIPLSEMKETFSDPYLPGVYRVGIDIPAGTYYVSPYKDNNYYAVFVMDDWDPNDPTILAMTYDEEELGSVTLHDGEYVELFNVTLSKDKTIGTKGPVV